MKNIYFNVKYEKSFWQFLLWESEEDNQFYVKEYFVHSKTMGGYLNSYNSKAAEQIHWRIALAGPCYVIYEKLACIPN